MPAWEISCRERDLGNSDSVLSGSLASPKPPERGEPEEHGDEENETQSRGSIQGSGGLAACKGDKTLAELAEQCGVHPTQITGWKQYLLQRVADVFGGTTPKPNAPDLKVLHLHAYETVSAAPSS